MSNILKFTRETTEESNIDTTKEYAYDFEEISRLNRRKRDKEIASRANDNRAVISAYGLLQRRIGPGGGGSGNDGGGSSQPPR